MRIVRYITEEMPKDELLTDRKIREIAKKFAAMQHLGEDRFKASSGWVENFKQRHGIKRGVWHGEGQLSKYSRSIGGDYAPMRRPPGIDLSVPSSVHVSGPPPNIVPHHQGQGSTSQVEAADYHMNGAESEDDDIVEIDPPSIGPSRLDGSASTVPQMSQSQLQPHIEPQLQSQHLLQPQVQTTTWLPEPHGIHEHVQGNVAEIAIARTPVTHRADGREEAVYVTPAAPLSETRSSTPTTEQAYQHLYQLRLWCSRHQDFVGFDDFEAIQKLMIDVENHLQGIPTMGRGKM